MKRSGVWTATSASVLFAVSGCSLLPSRQPPKTGFDFGPLGATASQVSPGPEMIIAVSEVTAPAWLDSTSMYYRLTYRGVANPMAYAQSEWIMAPSALLTQRLRASLAPASEGGMRRVSTHKPPVYVLRSELVDFEQIFDQPRASRGVLRVQATLEGEGMWMQRIFVVERPAVTADAPGGAAALSRCVDDLTGQVSAWVAGVQIGVVRVP